MYKVAYLPTACQRKRQNPKWLHCNIEDTQTQYPVLTGGIHGKIRFIYWSLEYIILRSGCPLPTVITVVHNVNWRAITVVTATLSRRAWLTVHDNVDMLLQVVYL